VQSHGSVRSSECGELAGRRYWPILLGIRALSQFTTRLTELRISFSTRNQFEIEQARDAHRYAVKNPRSSARL
jgi:hypothetical protein